MDFFMDRNVGVKMAHLIEAFDRESRVRHLDDEFTHDTPDTTWLHALGKRTPKPIVIGGDGSILRNEAEMQALKEAGLTYFVLAKGWTNLNWRDSQAWMIIKVWPKIIADAAPLRPTIYEVTVGLKVERICLTEELGRRSRRERG